MVRISNLNEDKKNPNHHDHSNIIDDSNKKEVKLSPELIKEMLKINTKQNTTPVNLRLETSIAEQIKLYASEHNTTMTEVIKDILTEYYFDKKITRGSFTLKKPVTLIIPESPELITEYINNNINIVSSIKQHDNNTHMNPLDPQINLNNLGSNHITVTITQGNNLLDEYHPKERCYNHNIKYIYELGFTNEEKFEDTNHRGLLVLDIEDPITKKTQALLVDTFYKGNDLLYAYITTPETAISYAEASGNEDITQYIRNIDTHALVHDIVTYDRTNEELEENNKDLREYIIALTDEIEELKLQNIQLKEQNRNISEDQDKDTLKYIESLKETNSKLANKVLELDRINSKRKKGLQDLEKMLKQYIENTR